MPNGKNIALGTQILIISPAFKILGEIIYAIAVATGGVIVVISVLNDSFSRSKASSIGKLIFFKLSIFLSLIGGVLYTLSETEIFYLLFFLTSFVFSVASFMSEKRGLSIIKIGDKERGKEWLKYWILIIFSIAIVSIVGYLTDFQPLIYVAQAIAAAAFVLSALPLVIIFYRILKQ